MRYKSSSLKDLISFISKGIVPKYANSHDENVIRVINQRCNRNGEITFKEARYSDLSKRKVTNEKLLKNKDILINSTGKGTAGRVAQISENQLAEPTTVDGHMIIIRPSEKIDPDYLGYALKAQQRVIESYAEGSTGQTEINKQRLLDETIIKYPSKEEQRKIANIFINLDMKIKNNQKINTNLLAIAKEKYQKMLASSLLTKTKLKDFATITMGQSPSSKTYNKEKQGVALLNGATDFRNGIHPSKWTTDPKKVVNKGAYIFGVRATIGLTTKVFNKYAIGRGTGSAVSKDTTNDEFLYFVLNDMFKDFKNTGSGSVYINISKKDLNEYTFYKPKINELISFHQTIAPIMNKIYTNNQENIVLTEIKENLLKQFF